jgi:hypothetical protein
VKKQEAHPTSAKSAYSPPINILRIVFWSSVALFFGISWVSMIHMPGKTYQGAPPPLSPDELTLRDELKHDVRKLGGEIGERNFVRYTELEAAAAFIEQQLASTTFRTRRVSYNIDDKPFHNLEAELTGNSVDIVLIGAHYDSVLGSPGANDNGSGVAALLALARRFAGTHNALTLRFVAFVNEEPPYFQTPQMGSYVYATNCRQLGDRIVAMLSLETIGYYSQVAGSQKYPMLALNLFYPTMGNFIGFVGNLASRGLLRDVIRKFRDVAQIPSEGGAMPEMVPGVG